MENKIIIILLPVESYSRSQAEFMENYTHSVPIEEAVTIKDALTYSLTDFMDVCNNQEVDLDTYWITYVNVKK